MQSCAVFTVSTMMLSSRPQHVEIATSYLAGIPPRSPSRPRMPGSWPLAFCCISASSTLSLLRACCAFRCTSSRLARCFCTCCTRSRSRRAFVCIVACLPASSDCVWPISCSSTATRSVFSSTDWRASSQAKRNVSYLRCSVVSASVHRRSSFSASLTAAAHSSTDCCRPISSVSACSLSASSGAVRSSNAAAFSVSFERSPSKRRHNKTDIT